MKYIKIALLIIVLAEEIKRARNKSYVTTIQLDASQVSKEIEKIKSSLPSNF